ncbi:MAG: FadR/GntR family transcriptional regulator [Janthinobacterium lividum]
MDDSSLDIKPIQSQRAFEEIAAQIRKFVSLGRLKPGDRLPAERELSAQFNVSRNTLREALRSLEIAGVIELRKGVRGGAFVLPGDSQVVVGGFRDLYHLGAITPDDLTESRVWIEEVVVRVACQRMTPADLAALEANLAETEAASKKEDMAGWIDSVLEFHRLLGQATRNPVMSIVIDAIIEILRQFIEAIGPQMTRSVVPSRRRMLAHLKAGDADAACAEFKSHCERVHQHYLSKLSDLSKAAKKEPPRSAAAKPAGA